MELSPPAPGSSAGRVAAWTALAVGLAFLVRALVFLYRAHPQDDAYILFGYVRRLVAGEGIVFYAGGPRAEGATDFLWFALLALLHRLGIDIALAAALLNAAGGAALGALLARPIAERQSLFPLLAPAAFAGAAVAAVVGFGSLFYAAAVAWTFAAAVEAWEGGPRAAAAIRGIPLAGLILGLIRPDGVVLGAGFAVVAGLAALREGLVRPFARRALAALVAGAAYFAWRWSYFGLPLPLPLYVKSHAAREAGASAALAGWPVVWGWLSHPSGAWPVLSAVLLLLTLGKGTARVRSLAVAALPLLLHLGVLCLAHQSQNIAFRFEAPAQATLLVLLALSAARAVEAARSASARAIAVLVALAGAAPGVVLGARQLAFYEGSHTYVDVFGPRLGEILLPEDKIALGDQAGRIPYWSRARIVDLVGLNTPRTALAPPDTAYLAEIDPDLFLLYAGPSVIDVDGRLAGVKEDLVELPPGSLAASVRPDQRDLYEHGIREYGGSSIPDSACNVIAARYIEDSGKYDLFAVRYTGGFKHVYAIRRGHPREAAVLEALRSSLRPESYRSYAREAGLPFARP
jgi:hypothetical protein